MNAVGALERRSIEAALGESEESFRALVEHVDELVVRFDAECRFMYVNAACWRYFGRRPDFYVGRNRVELGYPQEMAASLDTVVRRVFRLGRAEEHDFEADTVMGRRMFRRLALPERDACGVVKSVVVVSRDLSLRLRANDDLPGHVEELQALTRRLVDAQEAERRKVSCELHDLIGQNLTALGINLDIVKNELPPRSGDHIGGRIEQMKALLEESIDSVRSVMTELQPAVLDECGLSATLHQHAARFRERTGFHVQVCAEPGDIGLPREAQLALFRIVQEALTNSLKHSGVLAGRVLLRRGPGNVVLTVEDQGRGFRMRPERRAAIRGWGLMVMRERALAAGGRMWLETEPGAGTRVIVEVPV